MNKPYKAGDTLEVTITKIVPGGFGLAFAEQLTVMVPLAAVGDSLVVKILRIQKRTAFAEIVEIKSPGPQRVRPPCEYYGICGGCDMQHLPYSVQLETKLDIIRDCLWRIAKIDPELEISVIPSPQEFNYRSRARWLFDRDLRRIGYRRGNSHELVDIEKCLVLTPELHAVLDRLRSEFDWESERPRSGEILAAVGDDGIASLHSSQASSPPDEIQANIEGDRYIYSAQTFFQANRLLASKLIEAAISGAKGESALDLYCGVGLFSLPLARGFARVIGVEGNNAAIKLAKRNAENAGLVNTRFKNESVAAFLAKHRRGHFDFILLDPPRAGTEKDTIAAIAELRPAEISYVSCEPSILARDLRILLDKGYVIESTTALDMFPQTHHIETVVRLSNKIDRGV